MVILKIFSFFVIFIVWILLYSKYVVFDFISEKKRLINIYIFSVLLCVFVKNYDVF